MCQRAEKFRQQEARGGIEAKISSHSAGCTGLSALSQLACLGLVFGRVSWCVSRVVIIDEHRPHCAPTHYMLSWILGERMIRE